MSAYNLSLNPKIRNRFENKIDRNSSGDYEIRYEYIKEGAIDTYRENYLKDTKIFKGIVLKADRNIASSRLPFGGNGDEQSYITVTVRIPEIHAHIPEPCPLTEDGVPSENRGVIEMHPVFVGLDKDGKTPTPRIGSIVEVSFNKGPNGGIQSDGIYHGVYQEGPGETEGASTCDVLVKIFGDPDSQYFVNNPNAGLDGQPIGPGTPRRLAEETAARQIQATPSQLFSRTPLASPTRVTGEDSTTRRINNQIDVHRGIDFADGNILGKPVYNMEAGKITALSTNPNTSETAGNYVEIDVPIEGAPGGGVKVRYLHLQDNSIPSNFAIGREVNAGEVIGRVGNTGRSTGPHLHIDVRPSNTSPTDSSARINPRQYIPVNAFLPDQATTLSTPEGS